MIKYMGQQEEPLCVAPEVDGEVKAGDPLKLMTCDDDASRSWGHLHGGPPFRDDHFYYAPSHGESVGDALCIDSAQNKNGAAAQLVHCVDIAGEMLWRVLERSAPPMALVMSDSVV